MKVSVCIIAKNEEDQIREALSTVPSIYETIVLDTGSTDRTVEISQATGARVFHFAWNDNFADARNAAIDKATGDYILCLDADERLPTDVIELLNQFVKKYPLEAGAVRIKNVTNEQTHVHRMIRFFPNSPEFRFHGIVHERVLKKDQEIEPIDCEVEIVHYGYQPEQYEKKQKFERYIKLYQQMLEQNPADGYMLYQLGKLYFSNKQYKMAYDSFERCLKLEQYDRLYFAPMLVQLGYTLKELGVSGQAIDLLKVFLSVYPKYPDLPYTIGMLSIESGNISEIEEYLRLALNIGETKHYSTLAGSGSYLAAYHLGVYYEVTSQIDEAKHYYEISASLGFKDAHLRLENLKNTK